VATIHIDGKSFEVDEHENLLSAALTLGFDVPYFCWHPALGSVGACRQCAVKQFQDANDKRGRLVMSCMTPVTNNAYISVTDEEAVAFRASVIEWLMTNHPHDCPVCEEGGHCHLQDMTVMTRHASRRYRFDKRTHLNQDLGPFINHEMNRCIACYRCVRYYRDYAGGEDLGVFGSRENVYFGRVRDGTLENEFSGNLTEVCPTGVFTDKTHSDHYVRKWDLQFAPSICGHCSVGCNVSPGERYGEIRRIENRYNGVVNRYFLCDRGRFGYGYVNRKDRPRRAAVRRDGSWVELEEMEALNQVGAQLRSAQRVIGIGSPRATLESNYALRRLVGADNFFDGHGARQARTVRRALHWLRHGAAPAVTLHGIEGVDAALVLGEDVMHSAPRIALALRQMRHGLGQAMAAEKKVPHWQAEAIANIAQGQKAHLFVATPDATPLDGDALATLRASPGDLLALADAVGARLGAAVTQPSASNPLENWAAAAAQYLSIAKRPLIVCGTSLLDERLVDAAGRLAAALHAHNAETRLCLVFPEANSVGLALLEGGSLDDALGQLANGQADTLVVLENDLFRRADAERVRQALAKARVFVLDHQRTATGELGHALLPVSTVFEGEGTVVNNEGRAQRFFTVFDPSYFHPTTEINESWRWLDAMHAAVRGNAQDCWGTLDDVTAECAQAFPALQRITQAAPGARFRMKGMKIAREPHRYSGRTAMRANIAVHEPRAPQDPGSALAFSMEGYSGPGEPSALIPYAWSPGWNSPQSWNKFQDEVGGALRGGDAGIRLFEPGEQSPGTSAALPPAAAPGAGEFIVVPLQHLYGTEELSMRAEVVARQAPAPYIALSPDDAQKLGLTSGQAAEWDCDGRPARLTTRIHPQLSAGCVGLPLGLPGMPEIGEPERARCLRDPKA
jgi:NADH-quinone oxidoreductase subunit G